MRGLTQGCIAVVALLFATSSASAFAVSMTARGATTLLSSSDTVTVDVFLDSDGPITLFSVAVINSSPSALLYDGPASAALTPHPQANGTSGAQSSYILYSGSGRTHKYLRPSGTSYFLTFPPDFPGTEQVNINYFEHAFDTTAATGTGIYVATLVFHVMPGFSPAQTLSLAFTSSNIIQTGTFVHPPGTIGLSAPIVLTAPEPATGMLIGLGVVGMALTHRRRA